MRPAGPATRTRGASLALVLAAAMLALAPQVYASSPSQTFWAKGTGDFGVHAVQSGGGEVLLTQVNAGVVQWKDRSEGKDLVYAVSTGQEPVLESGWWTLNVGSTPIDITFQGSNFLIDGNATFTASIRAHGRVRTLGGSGEYGVGDDGNGNPLLKWPYDVKRVKVGRITSRAVTLVGRGVLRGDFNTMGKRLVFHGRRYGRIRFVDKSESQDMVVRCRGVGRRKVSTNKERQRIIVCRGHRGRATVRGSNVYFVLKAVRLKATLPANVAGHLRGRVGSKYHGFFSPF